MRFRNSAAGTEASRDAGESMPASTKGCGTLVAQGSGIQTGLVETNGEVLYIKNNYVSYIKYLNHACNKLNHKKHTVK